MYAYFNVFLEQEVPSPTYNILLSKSILIVIKI